MFYIFLTDDKFAVNSAISSCFSCAYVEILIDYEQSFFFLGPSSKTPETRKWPRAWLKTRSRHVPGEMRPSYDSLCCVSNVFFLFGKRDKHSCSASAIFNFSMVSIVDSLLSTLHASANRILRCEANAYFIGSGYAGSLFFLLGLPPSFLVSRSFAAQRSRTHALPLLNLKKKRDWSQSKILSTWEVSRALKRLGLHSLSLFRDLIVLSKLPTCSVSPHTHADAWTYCEITFMFALVHRLPITRLNVMCF